MIHTSRGSFALKLIVNLSILFCLLPLTAHSGGIASIEQIGDLNSSNVTQAGSGNQGTVVQWGEENSADLYQDNSLALLGNRAGVTQGAIAGCIGCIANINQYGSENIAEVIQNGEANRATINQNLGSVGNTARVDQFGDNNQATFNQEGSGNTGISAQVGDNNAFIVNQLNSDNYVSISQNGGAGAGGPFTITQDGNSSLLITQK